MAGVVSDPAFDLELGLAYLWDEAKRRNGGYRVYATRPEVKRNKQGQIVDTANQVIVEGGKPVTRWNHRRAVPTGRMERNPAADRLRVLDREARRRLAYGSGNGKRPDQISRERSATDKRLASIESKGRILIERDATDQRSGGEGWRILEVWPRRCLNVLPCQFQCSTLSISMFYPVNFNVLPCQFFPPLPERKLPFTVKQ